MPVALSKYRPNVVTGAEEEIPPFDVSDLAALGALELPRIVSGKLTPSLIRQIHKDFLSRVDKYLRSNTPDIHREVILRRLSKHPISGLLGGIESGSMANYPAAYRPVWRPARDLSYQSILESRGGKPGLIYNPSRNSPNIGEISHVIEHELGHFGQDISGWAKDRWAPADSLSLKEYIMQPTELAADIRGAKKAYSPRMASVWLVSNMKSGDPTDVPYLVSMGKRFLPRKHFQDSIMSYGSPYIKKVYENTPPFKRGMFWEYLR